MRSSRASGSADWWNEVKTTASSAPTAASRAVSAPAKSGPTVRRVLMTTTQNHVYYSVRDNEVVVLSVWGAPKERGPKL